ncbi:drebrin-like protein [Aphelenchoides avenae]|nr:drebrin-like protein [Aphelenchus avenae]
MLPTRSLGFQPAAQKSIKSQPQIVEVHDDAADEKSLIDQLDALQEAAVDVPEAAQKRQSVVAVNTEEVLVIAAAVPEKKTTETQADLPPKPVQNGHGPKPGTLTHVMHDRSCYCFTEAYAPSYYEPRPVPAEAAYYQPPARVEERPPSPPPRAIYDPRPPPQEDYYPAPQKALPSSIYRPTPLVAQLKADRERAGYSVPQYDERRPNPADVYDALYRQDSANDGGDYRNGGGEVPVHQKLANTPTYVPLYAPIPERINERPPKPYQPERPLSQVAPPVAQKPSWQQRRESAQASQPSSPPAAPKVLPRPLFSAADYGRMVECTTSYDATADNQLSLKTGDKVVLVKSGSRGWVLGRSEDGAKQGWFPAKFLKLL